LKKHNIDRRSRGPQQGCDFTDTEKLQDKEWLIEEYVEKVKSAEQIAQEHGWGQGTVLNYLEKHGIERRGQYEGISRSSAADKRLEDKEWLVEMYQEKEKSMYKIAKMCDVSPPAIKYRLDKFNIPRRSDSGTELTGDSVYQRDPDWDAKREKRLEKDNHECQDCGIEQSDYYRNLDVHHKTKKEDFADEKGDVDWDVVNDINNLVTLCQSCHMKRHHKTG